MIKWIINLFVKKKIVNVPTEIKVETVHRLSKSTYEKVLPKLPNSYVGNDTTAVEAAYKLGVAHTKEVFERELVV